MVEKQEARERGSGAKTGNRMGMIFIRTPGMQAGKVNDQAEDAEYVMQQKLPPDAVYYVVNQCKTPCESLLALMHPDPSALIDYYKKEAIRITNKVPRLEDLLKRAPKRAIVEEVDEQKESKVADEEASTSAAPPPASNAVAATASNAAASSSSAKKRKPAGAGMIGKWCKKPTA